MSIMLLVAGDFPEESPQDQHYTPLVCWILTATVGWGFWRSTTTVHCDLGLTPQHETIGE